MTVSTKDRRILEAAEEGLAEGKNDKTLARELKLRFRIDPFGDFTAQDYVSLAKAKVTNSRTPLREKIALAETASVQYKSWLDRAATWAWEKTQAALRLVMHRHPDTFKRGKRT